MDKYEVLDRTEMDCPICDKVHVLELRRRVSTVEIKGVEVQYEDDYYFCENAKDYEEDEFVTGEMLNENLRRAREAYRIKHG